ncbi:MAG: DUF3048 domain-containing protein [Anaerolineales bacterium]|nr:DUF3048 domain-containing protein [Anaerolineales bacterium]
MNFGKQLNYKNPIFWIFLILLTAACGSEATPAPIAPQALMPIVATLTPFQSQGNASANPYDQALAAPVELTFTPYPMGYIPSNGFSTPARIITETAKPNPLNIYNPLTGLPVGDPALLERRPMAIKVANSPDYIRPQSGLTLADVVFEYYIEWGDTRFIAVMYGNDSPMVGPVRSGRYFDEHVARMYNAFLVFKYADPREYSYLINSTLNDFLVVPGNRKDCPPFIFGPYKREEYNNYFFNTLKWADCAAKKGVDNSRQPLRGGFFAEEAPESALKVNRMFFHYSVYNYSYWEYDPITKKYFRSQEANDMIKGKTEAYAPLIDAQTGQQVTADNVVVLFAPHTFANQFNAHDQVYNIDLLDSGNAYVFRNGVALPAQWRRADINQPLLLTTLLGEPIYLHPGRTFYQVLGVNSSYEQNGTDWRFTFRTP